LLDKEEPRTNSLGRRVNRDKKKGRDVIGPGPLPFLSRFWIPALS